MPRYFFDVYDGREALRDAVGAEAEGPREAADEAAALLSELVREGLPAGPSRDFAAWVRDEAGEVVYRAALLFRGEWPGPATAAFRIGVSRVSFEVARSRRLKSEAGEIRARLRDNVRALMATLEQSMALREAGAGRLQGPPDGA